MNKRILLVSAALSLAGPAPAQFVADTLQVEGKPRIYHIHAPSGIAPDRPLVFAAHGANQQASYMMNSSKWHQVADRENFVVVYPQGLMHNILGGTMPGWDLLANGEDAKFFLAIIDEMAARYKIDRNRVYESGFSMGGMMGYTLACSHADKFAAIAPVSGFPMGGVGNCNPKRPIPLLHMHGATDDFVPYNRVESEILSTLRTRYNCPAVSADTANYAGNNRLSKKTWAPCDSGSEISFITLSNVAHAYEVPGITQAELAWSFFKRYSLPNAPAAVRPAAGRSEGRITVRDRGGDLLLQSDRAILGARLLDLRGRRVFAWTAGGASRSGLAVPVRGLRGGIYLLEADGGAGVERLKVAVPGGR